MSRPTELRALVVEADPGLREIFETLLGGWSLHFVQDPWTMPDPVPGDIDLLVLDEDYPGGPDGRIPAWLQSLIQRLPTIVLRTPTVPLRMNSLSLILPKPFPVSFFLAFADLVRQAKANLAPPPGSARDT